MTPFTRSQPLTPRASIIATVRKLRAALAGSLPDMAVLTEFEIWQRDLARAPRRPLIRALIAALTSWRK